MYARYDGHHFHGKPERFKDERQKDHGTAGNAATSHGKQQTEQNHLAKLGQGELHACGLCREHERHGKKDAHAVTVYLIAQRNGKAVNALRHTEIIGSLKIYRQRCYAGACACRRHDDRTGTTQKISRLHSHEDVEQKKVHTEHADDGNIHAENILCDGTAHGKTVTAERAGHERKNAHRCIKHDGRHDFVERPDKNVRHAAESFTIPGREEKRCHAENGHKNDHLIELAVGECRKHVRRYHGQYGSPYGRRRLAAENKITTQNESEAGTDETADKHGNDHGKNRGQAVVKQHPNADSSEKLGIVKGAKSRKQVHYDERQCYHLKKLKKKRTEGRQHFRLRAQQYAGNNAGKHGDKHFFQQRDVPVASP